MKHGNGLGEEVLWRNIVHKRIMEHKAKHPDNPDLEMECKYIKANIPQEYWGMTLENLDGHKTACNYVDIYCKKLDVALEHGFGFVMIGSNGTGKTSLQMIILKEALLKGYTALYMTMPEFFHRLYIGFDYKPAIMELHDLVEKTQFLAIGELGKDYHRAGSELFAISEFDMIFRSRRGNCLPTSLDSNMTVENLKDTYGESLMSLFSSRNKFMVLKGKDFRKTYQASEWREHMLTEEKDEQISA